MKKLISLVLSCALISSIMATTAFAVSTGAGTPGDPITLLPQTSINQSTGELKTKPQVIKVDGDKDLAISVTSVETNDGKNGKWEVINPLSAPSKTSCKTIINYGIYDGSAFDAANTTLTVNGTQIENGSDFTFKAGETYTLIAAFTNASSVISKMYWEFEIPMIDKNAPVLTIDVESGRVSKDTETGEVTISGDAALNRTVTFTVSDLSSGIKSIQVQEFNDKAMKFESPLQAYHDGKQVPCSDKDCATCSGKTTEDLFRRIFGRTTVNPKTKAVTDVRFAKTFSERDTYLKITTIDEKGTQSVHIVNIIGLTSQVDTVAPTVMVRDVLEEKDTSGKITAITGTVVVKDVLTGLKSVKISKGTEVLVDRADLAQNEFTAAFKIISADKVKKLTVDATDGNGNTNSGYVIDYTSKFNGDGTKPDEGGDTKPDAGTDKTKPTVSYDYTTNKNGSTVTSVDTTAVLSDETSLASVDVRYEGSNSALLNQTFSDGTKTSTIKWAVTADKKDSKIVITILDKAGNKFVNTLDYKGQFGNTDKPGTTGEIKSDRDLVRALKEPVMKYGDREVKVTFNFDQKWLKDKEVTWELRQSGRRDSIDTDAEGLAKNSVEYTFYSDERAHRAGNYELYVEYNGFKAKLPFTLEYRKFIDSDRDFANAIQVYKELQADGKCLIEINLDKGILADARDVIWTLPGGKKAEGSYVDFLASEVGSYTVKMRVSGDSAKDTFEYTVKVTSDDLDLGTTDEEPTGDGNKPDNSGNTTGDGNKPSNGGNTQYTGNDAPKPGKGVVNTITTDALTISIPMENWDAAEWSLLGSSIGSNVSYVVNGNTIQFKLPNMTFRMAFKMVNSKNETVDYAFQVTQLNADGSNKHNNAQTGGVANGGVATGVMMNEPIDLTFKKKKGTVLDDTDID